MQRCQSCSREFPVVDGAPEQVCPHCGETARADAGFASPTRIDPAGAAGHAWRFGKANYARLLAMWTPVVLVNIVVAISLTGYQLARGIPNTTEELLALSLGERLEFAGVAFPLTLIGFAATFTGWSYVAAYLADRTGTRTDRLARLKTRIPAAILLGVALSITFLAGVILLVVPLLIFFHMFMFAPAALAHNANSTGGAMEASRKFARDHRTYGYTALVLFVALGAYIFSLFTGAVLIATAAAFGIEDAYTQTILATLAAWPYAPIVALFPASFYALAKDAPPAPAPAANAPAADRFRTTKCPGCSTLVPYTATGAPVDVVCPVCGRAGRVL